MDVQYTYRRCMCMRVRQNDWQRARNRKNKIKCIPLHDAESLPINQQLLRARFLFGGNEEYIYEVTSLAHAKRSNIAYAHAILAISMNCDCCCRPARKQVHTPTHTFQNTFTHLITKNIKINYSAFSTSLDRWKASYASSSFFCLALLRCSYSRRCRMMRSTIFSVVMSLSVVANRQNSKNSNHICNSIE